MEVGGQVKYALCRCGHSEKKPFCLGAHKARLQSARGYYRSS
ncbi:CDGSH iron-sulfur domain-containing protein [Pyrobaculum sp.]